LKTAKSFSAVSSGGFPMMSRLPGSWICVWIQITLNCHSLILRKSFITLFYN